MFPPTRIPPALFLYKQNAAQLSFAPSQHLIVSTTIGGATDSPQQQQQQQDAGPLSTGKLPVIASLPQVNRKRWLPAETPAAFDRMEMRYLAQVFDKLVNPGEVADTVVPLDRARKILNLNSDGTGDYVPEEFVLATPPAESVLRLSQKMEGLLIGLHEAARLTAPASQDLTAVSTLAIDEVKSVFYGLLQHLQVQQQATKRERTLREEMEAVAASLRTEINELAQTVQKLSARMAQHYDVKPAYIENRKNAPKLLMLGSATGPTMEQLLAPERKVGDTYLPSENKSSLLHKQFVDGVLTTATPGVKSVPKFGRGERDGYDQVDELFPSQSNAMMISSERTCRLPAGVNSRVTRRHPPITRDAGVDCTDIYFFGHASNSNANSPGDSSRKGSTAALSHGAGGSGSEAALIRRVSAAAFPSSHILNRPSLPSAASPGKDDDPSVLNLFNFALPAPKLYAHAGVLFVQPVARLFQNAATVLGKQSHILGAPMKQFAGTDAVAAGATGFAQIGDLGRDALKLAPASYDNSPDSSPRPAKLKAISGVNVLHSDADEEDDDRDGSLLMHNRTSTGVMEPPSPSAGRFFDRRGGSGGGAGGGNGGGQASSNKKPPKPPRTKKSGGNNPAKSLSGAAAAGSTSPPGRAGGNGGGLDISHNSGAHSPDSPVGSHSDSQRASLDSRGATRHALEDDGGEASTSGGSQLSPFERRASKMLPGPAAGAGGFRRVGNALVSLIRKRHQGQGSSIGLCHVETQTDPNFAMRTSETQTAPMRDVFGMKIGGSQSVRAGTSKSGSTKKLRDASVPPRDSKGNTTTTNSNGGGKIDAASYGVASGAGGGGGGQVTEDTVNDIGSVLASFQEELGIFHTSSMTAGATAKGALSKRGGSPLGDTAKSDDKRKVERAARDLDMDEEALLDATGFVREKMDVTAAASVNTDVTLSGRHLHKMTFLDSIVACNIRHFDGGVAHKTPDYAIVPREVLDEERKKAEARRDRKEAAAAAGVGGGGGHSPAGSAGGGGGDVSVANTPQAMDLSSDGLSNNFSFLGSGAAAAAAAELNAGFVSNGSFGMLEAGCLSSGNLLASPPTDSPLARGGFSEIASKVAQSIANRKQMRTMHSSTILYAKSLPPLWRAELGARPNFAGARIKSREWTHSMVMECFRSIDLLLVCGTRPFPVNITEFVQSKFGEKKQARPYLLDMIVNTKVQSLSGMRCFVFVQLAELAGFAGIEDLPDIRSSSAFLFYYLFVTQRLTRTLSFRGIREFAVGALALNREAVVALLDAHLCHVAASFPSAAEWEAERRKYYSALLSLRRMTQDEMNVVRYMQQMQCIVDATKCEDPAPLVYKVASELTTETDLWKKLEGLNTLVPLHADIVVYLMVRNHDSLVDLVVHRARLLHVELSERSASLMRPILVSTEATGQPFEANVIPPPPLIAMQLLPVATPVAVPVHPAIAAMCIK